MTPKAHDLALTEIISAMNETLERHNCDTVDSMIVLESVIASAIASTTSHKTCCEATYILFEHVHERVHAIFNSLPESKDIH